MKKLLHAQTLKGVVHDIDISESVALSKKIKGYIYGKLYSEKTDLIYDARTSYEEDGAFRHLPTAEEIRLNLPNPCSWNTGMENSAMYCGIMLETIADEYFATGNESLKKEAEIQIRGLKNLCSVSGIRGFLARSISPEDGKSFYIDSSRDQYTHVIFGAYKYLLSSLCDEEERAFLTDMLVSFAEYAEKCVTEENEYKLLRADGKPGMVTCMYKYICPHEWARLPMFYLAAYNFSKDDHWLVFYKQVRDEAIDGSFKRFEEGRGVHLFSTDQMQISLRLLYDLEEEEEYKNRYLELMRFVAEYADGVAEEINEKTLDEKFADLQVEWRKQKFIYNIWIKGNLPAYGYAYNMPQLDGKATEDLWALHDAASAIHIKALCPDCKIEGKEIKAFYDISERVDYEKHATESPVYMINALWAMEKLFRENSCEALL